MDAQEKYDLLEELKEFLKGLKKFKRNLEHKDDISLLKKNIVNKLREELVCKAGALKSVVIELTGKEHIQRFGMVYNIWDVGLSAHRVTDICDVALDYCIDAVNEAIGKLESDIKKSKRDKTGAVIENLTKKQPSGKEIRKHLQGTPEEIAPHIARIAQEFEFQGFKYLAQEVSYKSSQFSKHLTILCGEYVGPQISFIGDTEDEEHPQNRCIGMFILQALPNTRTLLISKEKEPYELDNADSYFSSFLNKVFLELRQLGFVETLPKKVWQWIKTHKVPSIITTIIMLAAAVITIILYVKGVFG